MKKYSGQVVGLLVFMNGIFTVLGGGITATFVLWLHSHYLLAFICFAVSMNVGVLMIDWSMENG